MYAVIRTGGKQYKVEPGDRIKVEKLGAAEATLTPLLVVDGEQVTSGSSELASFPVVLRVVDQGRGRKIRAGKYKSKSRYYRRWGHRQAWHEVEITSIGDAIAPVAEAAGGPAGGEVPRESEQEEETVDV
jgi:large subunit ribosomal protein L21